MNMRNFGGFVAAAVFAGGMAAPALADQVILDDLIVDGSACIGFDCVNGESFGFDTLRLKENNLRIKFQDMFTPRSISYATTIARRGLETPTVTAHRSRESSLQTMPTIPPTGARRVDGAPPP